jgi:L-fuconate dehydratase
MTVTIRDVRAFDVRFPTSASHAGSDSMNPDPDYSAAYAVLDTDQANLSGHGLTFTIGRGNELCVEAIELLAKHLIGRTVEDLGQDMGAFWRTLVSDSQLRWLGPEKGVIHLATAALVNAAWDLTAKLAGKPLWKLLADMSPEELVGCVDFRYIDDALTKDEAIELLARNADSRKEREAVMRRQGFPAYTTSIGWAKYSDLQVMELLQEALAAGFSAFKLKVGVDSKIDLRRAQGTNGS